MMIESNGLTALTPDGSVGPIFFETESLLPWAVSIDEAAGKAGAGCCYLNAGTCPDCGGDMVRLGSCFNCSSCGYQSCG